MRLNTDQAGPEALNYPPYSAHFISLSSQHSLVGLELARDCTHQLCHHPSPGVLCRTIHGIPVRAGESSSPPASMSSSARLFCNFACISDGSRSENRQGVQGGLSVNGKSMLSFSDY
mmetsp:Transcript_10488/g.30862  ORF Transcript_10488/g.30862 Transcript_10488/m.30862 type:complete len:117 (-) Transcript_10488:1662-2012(-)